MLYDVFINIYNIIDRIPSVLLYIYVFSYIQICYFHELYSGMNTSQNSVFKNLVFDEVYLTKAIIDNLVMEDVKINNAITMKDSTINHLDASDVFNTVRKDKHLVVENSVVKKLTQRTLFPTVDDRHNVDKGHLLTLLNG